MTPEERSCLCQILITYEFGESKEAQLEKAFYTDKFRLLYEWISNREISLVEFITLLQKIKNNL